MLLFKLDYRSMNAFMHFASYLIRLSSWCLGACILPCAPSQASQVTTHGTMWAGHAHAAHCSGSRLGLSPAKFDGPMMHTYRVRFFFLV
jgi:hypothetical protein